MLVFDVFQGSMPRPKPREREMERNRQERLRLFGGLWESLHSLAGDGFTVLPNCVRHINVYCLCLLWNERAFLLCFFIPPCINLWSRAWQQENSQECNRAESNSLPNFVDCIECISLCAWAEVYLHKEKKSSKLAKQTHLTFYLAAPLEHLIRTITRWSLPVVMRP